MLSSRKLLSVQEAAGYAMAPPEDEIDTPAAVVVTRGLDDALRLGHLSAAHPAPPAGQQALIFTQSVVEPAKAALKGAMTGWWHGKAHA